jgi:hypothetical protein
VAFLHFFLSGKCAENETHIVQSTIAQRSPAMSQVFGNARKFLALCGIIAVIVTLQAGSVPAADNTPRVYLFRGFMNIFSTGMDEVAATLRARGIKATSLNHVETDYIAGQLIEDYKKGKRGPIVLIGHSLGATAVVDMSNKLSDSGVPVTLVVSLDPISGITATGRVQRLINLYLPEGSGVAVSRGRTFRGTLQNINVAKTDVGHVSIAQSDRIHNILIGYVTAAIGPGRRASSGPAVKQKKDAPSVTPITPAQKQDKPADKPTAASASTAPKSQEKGTDKPTDKPAGTGASAVDKKPDQPSAKTPTKKKARPASKPVTTSGFASWPRIPFFE